MSEATTSTSGKTPLPAAADPAAADPAAPAVGDLVRLVDQLDEWGRAPLAILTGADPVQVLRLPGYPVDYGLSVVKA